MNRDQPEYTIKFWDYLKGIETSNEANFFPDILASFETT